MNIAGTHDFNAFGDDDDRGEQNAQTGLSSSIFVDDAGGNFRLSTNTAPGTPLESPYDVDADGAHRITWSRGAYEH